MFETILLQAAVMKISYAMTAVVAVVLFLRLLDNMLGIRFKTDVWAKMNDSSQAIALYFGLRYCGTCLLFAILMS